MGGSNPYIPASKVERPGQKYSIEFQPFKKVIEIDPSAMPSSGTGLPGSVLDIALACGVDIDHACGGVAACSTCHIIVNEGLESCNESSEAEEDQLEKAPGLTSRSRLACQCVANGTKKLVVTIPGWNRNLVREGREGT